jgi:hypothetical protein
VGESKFQSHELALRILLAAQIQEFINQLGEIVQRQRFGNRIGADVFSKTLRAR